MINTNTNLLNAPPVNDLINEAIRIEVEKTINLFLQEDLTDFLCYEKHSVEGDNVGNFRNGYYERSVNTTLGPITVKIPRNHNSKFKNFNKYLKHYTNQKEQFPTEDSLDRFVYARVNLYP